VKLPNADNAVVEAAKLRDYCLNPAHPEGRHKARVFRSALGVGQEQAEWLREAILSPRSRMRKLPMLRKRPTVGVMMWTSC